MSESNAFNSQNYKFQGDPSKERVVIVAAEWHKDIVDRLLEDAKSTLEEQGFKNIETIQVPGCFELTQAATLLLARDNKLPKSHARYTTGIICLGCLVQGETPHFTFISEAVSQGLTKLSMANPQVPLMFGVLTTNTREQAIARADGTHSAKGKELAVALMKMMEARDKIYGLKFPNTKYLFSKDLNPERD